MGCIEARSGVMATRPATRPEMGPARLGLLPASHSASQRLLPMLHRDGVFTKPLVANGPEERAEPALNPETAPPTAGTRRYKTQHHGVRCHLLGWVADAFPQIERTPAPRTPK